MENLMTNISLWGVIVVLINTLRISWEIKIPAQTDKLSSDIHLALEKFHIFLKNAYKPLTVFILSAFTLFACYKITSDKFIAMWGTASLAGVMSIGVSMLLKPSIALYTFGLQPSSNSKNKAISILFKESNITNGGTLLISLISLLIVFSGYYNNFTWNTFTVLSFIASFAMGASSLLLCMHVYEKLTVVGKPYNHMALATAPDQILTNDRFDSLGGALIAAMLLGTTFSANSAFKEFWLPSGAVLLPLMLAISGVCISALSATFTAIKGWKTPAAYLLEKMISALLMIVVAFVFIQLILPQTWVLNGLEHASLEVFYAAQIGIIGGLLTNKVTRIYRSVHRKYFTYLIQKSFELNFLDKAFHFFINTFSTIMPVLLIVFSILLSYYLVGLYGILIALVTMLANITTRLTVGK